MNYLTPAQAAEILHCSPETLKDWRYKAIGPAYVRLGYRTIGYRLQAIATFVDERTEEGRTFGKRSAADE